MGLTWKRIGGGGAKAVPDRPDVYALAVAKDEIELDAQLHGMAKALHLKAQATSQHEVVICIA